MSCRLKYWYRRLEIVRCESNLLILSPAAYLRQERGNRACLRPGERASTEDLVVEGADVESAAKLILV